MVKIATFTHKHIAQQITYYILPLLYLAHIMKQHYLLSILNWTPTYQHFGLFAMLSSKGLQTSTNLILQDGWVYYSKINSQGGLQALPSEKIHDGRSLTFATVQSVEAIASQNLGAQTKTLSLT